MPSTRRPSARRRPSSRETGAPLFVTGAAQGIGKAISRALHAGGASVVVADLDRYGAERVAASLGDRCAPPRSTYGSIEQLLDAAVRLDGS